MKINWKVRFKNKQFWLAIVPALFMLVQTILKVFDIEADFSVIMQNVINVINAAFVVAVILGIVTDPTTEGISDSDQALGYAEPKRGTEDHGE